MQPQLTPAELDRILAEDFPQLLSGGHRFTVRSVGPREATVALEAADHHLRPGGTISGPTLFTLADVAAYVVILAHLGPVLSAVTTNLSINFLTRPKPGLLIGRSRVIRLGRRLAVVEITISQEGEEEPCAHAVANYALPKEDRGVVL